VDVFSIVHGGITTVTLKGDNGDKPLLLVILVGYQLGPFVKGGISPRSSALLLALAANILSFHILPSCMIPGSGRGHCIGWSTSNGSEGCSTGTNTSKGATPCGLLLALGQLPFIMPRVLEAFISMNCAERRDDLFPNISTITLPHIHLLHPQCNANNTQKNGRIFPHSP
jgi:hypothetical protein